MLVSFVFFLQTLIIIYKLSNLNQIVTDEILHGFFSFFFSVSEQISRLVRHEVGDATESMSANWQNIFSVRYHRIHSTFSARSALIILMTLIFSPCWVGRDLTEVD